MTQGNGDLYEDETSRERAIRYSRVRQWLVLAGLFWSGTTTCLALGTGLSARMRTWAEDMSPPRLGPAMLYTAVGSLLSFLASLPLSYYGGYVVEHRYNLSNQSRLSWLVDELKGLAVGLVVGSPLVQAVYWIIRRYPRRWWAILSALTVPFTVLLVRLAPVLIMPLFNRFEPIRNRSLAERVRALSESQGVHVSDVLEMDMSRQTKKANAFFTGMGRTKRIVLGDTLLKEFTEDEVEVVLAHELAHQVHRDLWKLIGLGTAVTTLTSWIVSRAVPPLVEHFGDRFGLEADAGVQDVAAMPLLTLVAGAVSLVLLPVQNAITRTFVEHPADRFALDVTGKREAFIGAMEKLGRMNLSNPRPSTLIKWVLYDHPTMQERIDFGRGYVPPRG